MRTVLWGVVLLALSAATSGVASDHEGADVPAPRAAPPASAPSPPPPIVLPPKLPLPATPAEATPAGTPDAPPPPPPPPARISGKVSVTGKNDATTPGEGAVVYIENVDAELWSGRRSAGPQPKIAMKDKRFEPRVVPVLAGKSVSFPNLDPIFHNAFSLAGNNKFDLGLYKDGKSKEQTFASPGVVRVFCNIHPAMRSYVLVMQNPWFASVAADGTYRLSDVPPGTWKLKVWHERGGESIRDVTVKAGQRVTADFDLDGRKFKEIPHTNKEGKPYGATPTY